MKAVINLAERKVVLYYIVDKVDDKVWGHQTDLQYNIVRKVIKATQTVFFKDLDEWQSIQLLDGRYCDLHFDYVTSNNFNNRTDWLSAIINAYEYKEEPQKYDKQLITKYVLEL
jgi:hypothetical protein